MTRTLNFYYLGHGITPSEAFSMANSNDQQRNPSSVEESSIQKPSSCCTTLVHGLPPVRLVCGEIFYWNGTPWLNEGAESYNNPTSHKITDHAALSFPTFLVIKFILQ